MLPPPGPARALAASVLVNALGNGLSLTGGVLFLIRVAGLSAGQVGLGLTIAGIAGLAGGVLLGERADRLGARRVLLATLLLEAAGVGLLAATRSFPVFLVAALLAAMGHQGGRSSRGALVALIAGPEGRGRLLAQLRALTNIGISVGAVIAGLAVAIDTTAAYTAIVLGDAATFLLAAAIVLRVPAPPPTRAERTSEPQWPALADGPYLAVAAVNAVLGLNYRVLTVGIPLWLGLRSDAPTWLVAPLMLLNTLLIVALQVRTARDVTTPSGGALALRRAGVAFLAAWTLIGLAGGGGVVLAVGLLVLGVVVHTFGELWQAAASFELSFALARADAQGQYQGVFGVGQGIADAVAPVLLTAVCVAGGVAGWTGFGAAVAAVAALAPVTVAWAQRTGVRLAVQPG